MLRFSSPLLSVYVLLLFTTGCARSAQHYTELADRQIQEKKYDDAILNYRKAIQKDQKSGEAYYGLALAMIERNQMEDAYGALQQAEHLLPQRADIKAKFAELTLAAYQGTPGNDFLYKQLDRLANDLLTQDPKSFDGLRMKGNLALLDKHPTQAIEYFRKANEIRPLDDYLMVSYLQALFDTDQKEEVETLSRQMIDKKKTFLPIYDVLYNNYARANFDAKGEAVLKEKIKNNPQDPTARLQLAAHYKKSKDAVAMKQVLDGIMQNPPKNADSYKLVGDFYATTQDLPHASEVYEKGLKENPSQAISYKKQLAKVRVSEGKGDDALRLLNEVHSMDAKDQEASLLRADLLLARGRREDLDTVIDAYKAGVASQPGNLMLQSNLGKAYLAKNNLPEARRMLSGVLQQNPEADIVLFPLSTVALLEKKPDEALSDLDKILTKSARDPRARYMRTVALMGLGRYDEASDALDSMVREFPRATDLKMQQGLIAILSKHYQDAQRIFTQLSATGVNDFRIAEGLAEAYVGQQEIERAIKVLEAEVAKNPDVAFARSALAKVLIQSGKYDSAIAHLQELKKQQPKSAQVLIDLGDAYRSKGDYPHAQEQFQAALALTPASASANLYLGFTLLESGHAGEAIPAFRRSLELSPHNSLVMNNLAYSLAAKGGAKELDEALQLSQEALRLSPKEPDFRDTLGWVYLKKGMADSAIQVLANLNQENPQQPAYLHHWALAQIAKGDISGAKKSLAAALAAGPSKSEEAQIRKDLELSRLSP